MVKLIGSKPKPELESARLQMLAALKKHNLEPMEMLALTGYLAGQLIAMQDQRKVTPAMATKLLASNIEAGNKFTIDELLGSPKGNG